MVPPHEVVLQLYNALNVFRIVFLKKEKQFGFDSCLVVVFFLVFNKFNSHLSVGFVIYTFYYLPKSTLTNHLDVLETVRYLIPINYSIISFLVIETVINKSF
jgi:hypothetical protein